MAGTKTPVQKIGLGVFANSGSAEKDEAPGMGGWFGRGFTASGRASDPGDAVFLVSTMNTIVGWEAQFAVIGITRRAQLR
jgi:hypothetical protein